jgi:Ser/Thr protein kinase RdoA (MazF antagonist)
MANHVAMSAARAVGAEVDVPEPVAYLVPLKTVLMRAVPGEPITRRLLAGDQALAGRTAEALWALHHSGAELTGVHSLERELAPLARRTAELAVADPELASLAWSCWAEVEDGAGRVTRWRRRPIHRDFYEDQVRAGAHRLAVLDFDDAALSEPAVDVANFLAHLRLLALQAEGHAAALGAVAATFRQRYGELDPELDPQTVNYLEAATLLRLAHIHRSRPDGARLARGLLSACRRAWNARPALLV